MIALKQGLRPTAARQPGQLSGEELQKFSDNLTGEIRGLAESFESSELPSASLYMMRRPGAEPG